MRVSVAFSLVALVVLIAALAVVGMHTGLELPGLGHALHAGAAHAGSVVRAWMDPVHSAS
jgi:hypothetical protein